LKSRLKKAVKQFWNHHHRSKTHNTLCNSESKKQRNARIKRLCASFLDWGQGL